MLRESYLQKKQPKIIDIMISDDIIVFVSISFFSNVTNTPIVCTQEVSKSKVFQFGFKATHLTF